MSRLTMRTMPGKASVNNSPDRVIGVELFLTQISREEPFASLFSIDPKVMEAIKEDMTDRGFDFSKPVNVWRKDDGTRLLIDGYTRFRAAEDMGFMKVTAYEMTFESEEAALNYAIHSQRDRRNLTDAELLHLIELVDQRQKGFRATLAPFGANGEKPAKTAEITAKVVGVSLRKVERARTALSDGEEAEAVKKGKKTIFKAATDSLKKRAIEANSENKNVSRINQSNSHRKGNTDDQCQAEAIASSAQPEVDVRAISRLCEAAAMIKKLHHERYGKAFVGEYWNGYRTALKDTNKILSRFMEENPADKSEII